eukprot:10557626-Alexandrium_andersonii.AAC.1
MAARPCRARWRSGWMTGSPPSVSSSGSWSSSSGASCHTELAGWSGLSSPGAMARGGPHGGREWRSPSGGRS